MRGYFLDSVGGLMTGIKLFGDEELTANEYAELFAFAPEHRAQALPILRRMPEYEAAAEAHMHAVVEEVSASDDADKEREEYAKVLAAHNKAAEIDPNAPDCPKVELDAARANMTEAAAKYKAAAEAQTAAAAVLRTLADVIEKMPPRRVAAA